MSKPAKALRVSRQDREVLNLLARAPKTPQRVALRARIVRNNEVTVSYPRRAHNPILRRVPWSNLPGALPGVPGARLKLEFK